MRKHLELRASSFITPFVLAFLAGILASTSLEGAPMTRKPLPSPDVIKNLPPDGGDDYNRLVFSQSPYLLQHAANPVDWHPWGDEAFELARKQNKPVFLSIGYSTCHWCHVMEHESFEDEEVAALMNKYFVCIKVDREERPDVDKIYMDVTQALTGSGGWPMTVVLTPDRKPFFAGTYFPKSGGYGRPGMMDLLPKLNEAWTTDQEKVIASAEQITQHLVSINAGQPGADLGAETLTRAFEQLGARFDAQRGGFGNAPKFPTPHNLTFLHRYGQRHNSAKALEMVNKTLTEMRLGGIYDHIGFGFHRYSTDRDWLLPHFEKMLYDQALIAIAYLDAYQSTRNPMFAQTAREIFTYVLRDMTSPEGGFYSAEDADSEGVEGKFYVWRTEELREVLGPEESEFFIKLMNCRDQGNFTHEAGGQGGPDNIPHLDAPVTANDVERLERVRKTLFDVREKRIHPLKDDKVLTDWNGLMIAAFAHGAQVLHAPEYEEAARNAADFALNTLRDESGRLHKRYRQGQAGLPAHLEDYAFLTWGLLNLYETTFDVRYLREAVALTDTLLKHFWDAENGGLFLTADDGGKLLVRAREVYDGAIPSGNSIAAANLFRLARMTGNTTFEEKAAATIRAFSAGIKEHPLAYTQMLGAVDFGVGPSYEIVIAGNPDSDDTQAMIRALRDHFVPGMVVLLRPEGNAEALGSVAPFTETMGMRDGKATAYVCQNFACKQPTTEIPEMLSYLGIESGTGSD